MEASCFTIENGIICPAQGTGGYFITCQWAKISAYRLGKDTSEKVDRTGNVEELYAVK